MHDLRNLTNSPYVITLAEGGTKVLPARGELKGVEVHPMYVQQIKNCGYIEISESGKSSGADSSTDTKSSTDGKPSDTKSNTDGKPSDTKSSADGGDLEELREEYTELTGEEPDLRWGKKRLESEIEQAFNGK